MTALRSAWARVVAFFRKTALDREIDQELSAHIELATEEFVRHGMTEKDARRLALVKLGGVEQTKEVQRASRGVPWLDGIVQDTKFAVRTLQRHPDVVIVAVLSVGLGIGANTTIFSFANALLFRPLPFGHVDQVLTVREMRYDEPSRGQFVSYLNFRDWQNHSGSGVELAAMRAHRVTLSDANAPQRYTGAVASWNLFPMLQIRPALGRTFREDEDVPGADPVVVLSEALWEQRYGSDPAIVGTSVSLDGIPHTVIGVAPLFIHPGLPVAWRNARLWVPLAPVVEGTTRDERNLFAYAKVDASLEAVRRDLESVTRGLAAAHPENDGWGIDVQPVGAVVSPINRAMLALSIGAVGFVLIACSNVANLLLARATNRRREFAIRLALGGSRGRLVRQLMTEGLLLTLICVPVGILLSWWGVDLVLQLVGDPGVPIPIDFRVLSFAVGLSLLTALLFGLVPAREALRGSDPETLQHDGRAPVGGRRHTHLRNVLVISQVALSLTLLVGASLLIQSFVNRLNEDEGFDTAPILHLAVAMSGDHYETSDAVSRRVSEFVSRLEAVPGVESVALSDIRPLRGGGTRATAIREGAPRAEDARAIVVGGITSAFFETLNLPLLQGRPFTDTEGRTPSPVAIINWAMARAFWPDQDALGRRFRLMNDADGEWYTVVGVSRDISSWDVGRVRPTAHLPYSAVAAPSPSVFIRSSGDPTVLANPATDAIQAIDATLQVYNVQSMDAVHRSALLRSEFMASTFSVLGVIAVLLAAAGIFGVLSYVVSQRTHEVGLRMALGADRGAVVWLVVRDGLAMIAVGTLVGLVGAATVTRVARGLLS